jgi:uncharacterized membrane protein
MRRLNKTLDSGKRSILKTMSYRIITTIMLAIMTYLYTGDLFQTSAESLSFSIIATGFYYVHERMWTRIKDN